MVGKEKKPNIDNADLDWHINDGVLRQLGIAPESVKCICTADLDRSGEYRLSWLILTDDMLYVLRDSDRLGTFKTGEHHRTVIPADCDKTAIELSRISDIRVEPKVASLVVVARVDGEDRFIACASNNHAYSIRRMTRMITHSGDEEERRPPMHGDKGLFGPHEKGKKRTAAEKNRLTKRLFGFFRPYTASVITVMFCFAITSLISLASPYLSGTVLYGEVLKGKPTLGGFISPEKIGAATALAAVVGVMILTRVLTQLFNAFHSFVVAKFVPKVVRDIKSRVFDAMSRLSISFYHSRETGTLMTRVLDDADQVTSLFIDDFPSVITGVATLIIAAVIMFTMNWQLAVLAFVLMPVSSVIFYFIMPKLWVMYGRRHRAGRKLSSSVNDNIVGARVVRAFGRQSDESSRFESVNGLVRQAEIDIVTIDNRINAVFSIVSGIIPMIVTAVASYFILDRSGMMDYSQMITFTGYVGMLSQPLEAISSFLRQWIACMNSAQRIFEIIDAKPDVVQSEHPVHLENIRGDVELRNVCFAYDKGNPVLEDVSFSIEKGKLLGIVGRSGAGKSTLLNLITRLYDVDEGQVLIDGVDIRDIALEDLRGLVSMVSQETYIFMGTVAENIAYARPDASLSEIIDAAKLACAHDFIMKLPDGYDTVIGTSGRELSGGERQRLSIARAVLTDPKILMLDEATAAIDTETEMNIQIALEKLSEGRTTISVAHRLSTLRNADKLVVIERGRVVESGTHHELMELKGEYFTLADIQRKALERRGI